MSLEMIQDALFDHLKELDAQVFSWQKEVERNLEDFANSLFNRSDFNLERFEIFKKKEYLIMAQEDIGKSIEYLRIAQKIKNDPGYYKNDIENGDSKIKEIGEMIKKCQ